jgi:Ala-tRNA(Pro) deacylase
MIVQKLKDFLDINKVKYVAIKHSTAYTAQEVAASAHVPGELLAKTVIVKVDGKLAMAVLRATDIIDMNRLEEVTDARNLELAQENEFRGLFPDCEIGAMPPFGNLYGIPVFVEERLSKDKEIAFNAGSHAELIRLAYEDFNRLVKPATGTFAMRLTACL